MNEYTKGPWHIGLNPGPIIYDEKSNQVVNMCDGLYGDDENRANAQLIVTAVNVHADLVAVLKVCEEYFDQRADAEYFTDSPQPKGNEEMSLLTEIRATLKKVKQ